MRRSVEIAALAALAMALAGCPAEREVEETPATEERTVEAGPTARPEAREPVTPLPAPERIELAAVAGADVVVEAVVSPVEGETHVALLVRQAPANAGVRASLNSGTCAQPGALVEQLEPVTTDALGSGRSEATVEVPPQIVFDGQHHIQVHANAAAPGELTSCGDIPARQVPVGGQTAPPGEPADTL